MCCIEYGRDIAIYIDTAKSTMTLPQHVTIPWFWQKRIQAMCDDVSLTVRLTVLVNNMNYTECVLPIKNGAANASQFKRAAMEWTSPKYAGVNTPMAPSEPPAAVY